MHWGTYSMKSHIEKNQGVIDSLKEKVIAVPYRQTSLNGTIRQILKSTSNPIVFPNLISDIDLQTLMITSNHFSRERYKKQEIP